MFCISNLNCVLYSILLCWVAIIINIKSFPSLHWESISIIKSVSYYCLKNTTFSSNKFYRLFIKKTETTFIPNHPRLEHWELQMTKKCIYLGTNFGSELFYCRKMLLCAQMMPKLSTASQKLSFDENTWSIWSLTVGRGPSVEVITL